MQKQHCQSPKGRRERVVAVSKQDAHAQRERERERGTLTAMTAEGAAMAARGRWSASSGPFLESGLPGTWFFTASGDT